jgi:small subunit ribosomal protein S15
MNIQEKTQVVNDFAIHANDTGSMSVQIALLTQDIRLLTEHCQKHPKDHSTRRGLLKKVNQRKRFLKYVEKHNYAEYKTLIERLGIRK